MRQADLLIAEIRRREHAARMRRARRIEHILSAACVTLGAALVAVVVSRVPPGVPKGSGYYYGALMLSAEAGAYILVATIAFIAGILASAAIRYHRKSKNTSDGKAENGDDQQQGGMFR